ncbi:MAG: hypothetical protein ACRD7E_29555 [Bryobacteraceae bacterium]
MRRLDDSTEILCASCYFTSAYPASSGSKSTVESTYGTTADWLSAVNTGQKTATGAHLRSAFPALRAIGNHRAAKFYEKSDTAHYRTATHAQVSDELTDGKNRWRIFRNSDLLAGW